MNSDLYGTSFFSGIASNVLHNLQYRRAATLLGAYGERKATYISGFTDVKLVFTSNGVIFLLMNNISKQAYSSSPFFYSIETSGRKH